MSNSYLIRRLQRVAEALSLTDEILLVGAGEPVPLPEGTDQTYPYQAHSEYYYLTGLECPGGVVAFDPKKGPRDGWVSFVPDITNAERIWEGRTDWPGESVALLEPWLTQRRGRSLIGLGAPLRGVRPDNAATVKIRERFSHARRPKDATELEYLRRTASATAYGYAAVKSAIKPGITERELQIELETGFFRGGASKSGYGTIIGTGPNSAILHFPPSQRKANEGEFVLIDAGAEIDRYVTDVTRTFVVDGQPTRFQSDLHQLVVETEESAIERCLPGAEWKEIHLHAAVQMVAGLVEMDIMHGNPESLVEQEAHRLFFPHGLGHLVGLGVRDASGLLPSRQKDPRRCLSNLRMDLPLEEGYVTTVEPGLYFIPSILNDPKNRDQYRDSVNWSLAEQYFHLGGVRIEDNVLVTRNGPEVLTRAIPKGWL
jgi:Xaa-Pro aminopeptidase